MAVVDRPLAARGRRLVGAASAHRGVSITEPAVAVRAAREAVKVEKARGLVRLVGDVGRVQSKAGTQAALDGLELAEGPREMSRARAARRRTKGGKTRAILKLAGRGAILLTLVAWRCRSLSTSWVVLGAHVSTRYSALLCCLGREERDRRSA